MARAYIHVYILSQGVITFNSSSRAAPSRTASLLAVVVIKVAHACVTS